MRGQGAVGSWIEGMAAICFFTLCLSQWVLVFGISDQISRHSQDFHQAVILAESVAEVWKAWGTEGVIEKLGFSEEENENSQKERRVYRGIIREEWQAVLEVKNTSAADKNHKDGMWIAQIRIEKGRTIFELEVKKYQRE